MKRHKKLILAVVLLVSMVSISAYAQQAVTTNIGAGQVDWSTQVIRAKGMGVPDPSRPYNRPAVIRAAKLDALRQLLETVKGIQLSSETTVEMFMTTSDVVRSRVDGVLRNFYEVGDPVYMSDGTVELTVELRLSGNGQFYDAVMSPTMGGSAPLNVGPVNNSSVYTGLVIDARGLSIRPAIAPRILSESGDEVYGSRVVNRDWAIKNGMVGYAKEFNAMNVSDQNADRIGNSPLVLKAVQASGPNRNDVVIRDSDANTLHGVSENFKFLQQCKVIFLVD